MASSSIIGGTENDPLSDSEEKVQNVIFVRDIPKYKGVPCQSWTTKCVSLHNDNEIPIAEGICHSVKSELVVEVLDC
jgi:hypothetical protein